MSRGRIKLFALGAVGLIGLAVSAKGDTINVDGLQNLGGTQWQYTTDMTATGAAVDNTDSFSILSVQGFVNFDASHPAAKDFTDAAGKTWHAVAAPQGLGSPLTDIQVTYGGPGTEFGANLAASFHNLVNIVFNDLFSGRSAGATWRSQDHGVAMSSTGSLTLTPITEASAGVIDTPASAVPVPASVWGGAALLGLFAAARRRRLA